MSVANCIRARPHVNRYKSPLRYPGGKQRLAPFISELMAESSLENGNYAEPYAGGAGVAVHLLLSGVAKRIHLNDLSRPVYCFWRSVLQSTDELCRRIVSASLTVDEWKRQREVYRHEGSYSELDVAFSLLYLNRCNRSGIPTGGLI